MRLGDVIQVDCGLGLFGAGRICYMEVAFECDLGVPLVWDGQVAG